MSKKQILGTIGVYLGILILATIFFIMLFHIKIFNGLDVFFYRGCIFLLLASFFAGLLTWLAVKNIKNLSLNIKDVLVVACLFFGITLGWFTLLPTTVERSVSVFMLSYMYQNDTVGITADEFGDVFYQKYISDFGAFDKRFNEQILSGNIKPADDGNGYVITANGRFVVDLFRTCAKLFNTEQWLVYPNDYGEINNNA